MLIPLKGHMGSNSDSEKLRELEEEIARKIREAAREWQALCARKRGKYPLFWEDALPAEIATICNHFGLVACRRVPDTKTLDPNNT